MKKKFSKSSVLALALSFAVAVVNLPMSVSAEEIVENELTFIETVDEEFQSDEFVAEPEETTEDVAEDETEDVMEDATEDVTEDETENGEQEEESTESTPSDPALRMTTVQVNALTAYKEYQYDGEAKTGKDIFVLCGTDGVKFTSENYYLVYYNVDTKEYHTAAPTEVGHYIVSGTFAGDSTHRPTTVIAGFRILENEEEPDMPWTPIEPSEPIDPEEPEVPWTPIEPSEPIDPEEPDMPWTPIEPSEPIDPEEPEVPMEPLVPAEPKDPEITETPEETPIVTVTPAPEKQETTKTVTPPKTADATDVMPYATAFVIAALAILTLVYKKSRI